MEPERRLLERSLPSQPQNLCSRDRGGEVLARLDKRHVRRSSKKLRMHGVLTCYQNSSGLPATASDSGASLTPTPRKHPSRVTAHKVASTGAPGTLRRCSGDPTSPPKSKGHEMTQTGGVCPLPTTELSPAP